RPCARRAGARTPRADRPPSCDAGAARRNRRRPALRGKQLGSGTYVNLMGQYYPAGRTERQPEIDRPPYAEELLRAFEIADSLGLRRLDERSRRQTVGARYG